MRIFDDGYNVNCVNTNDVLDSATLVSDGITLTFETDEEVTSIPLSSIKTVNDGLSSEFGRKFTQSCCFHIVIESAARLISSALVTSLNYIATNDQEQQELVSGIRSLINK